MIIINNIPHLRVYRQKVYLPKDTNAASMYNIVFSNKKRNITLSELFHKMLSISSHILY